MTRWTGHKIPIRAEPRQPVPTAMAPGPPSQGGGSWLGGRVLGPSMLETQGPPVSLSTWQPTPARRANASNRGRRGGPARENPVGRAKIRRGAGTRQRPGRALRGVGRPADRVGGMLARPRGRAARLRAVRRRLRVRSCCAPRARPGPGWRAVWEPLRAPWDGRRT